MNATALGVAVWGLGGHALKQVLPAMRRAPGVVLRGVCSRNEETVARTARELGCTGWTTPGAMFDDAAVGAVYVSTPIGLHAEHGGQVIEAGRHLWCEKPLAANANQAAALIASSRARGVMVGEGFMYLYHPQFIALREMVHAGALGDLCGLACRFGIPPLDRPGFRQTAALGGGAFLDVGSYTVSFVAALFPGVDPAILHAEITVAPESPVDSAGRALLAYPGGLRATLEWGTSCAYRNEVDLWGTEQSVLSERIFSKPAEYVPRFRFLDRHGRESFEDGQPRNHFIAMIEAFRKLVDDPAAAERERTDIARRAALMDRIRNAASQES